MSAEIWTGFLFVDVVSGDIKSYSLFTVYIAKNWTFTSDFSACWRCKRCSWCRFLLHRVSLNLTLCQCFGCGSSQLSCQTDRVVKMSGPRVGKRPNAESHCSSDTDTIAHRGEEVTRSSLHACTNRQSAKWIYTPVLLFCPPNNPPV